MKSEFLCSLNILSRLRETILKFCIENELSDIVSGEIELAVNEACTNIINYGGLDSEKDFLTVEIEKENKVITITIVDSGKQFNFNSPRDISSKDDIKQKRPKAGMGIFIIRQLVDGVIYNRLPKSINELKLMKKI